MNKILRLGDAAITHLGIVNVWARGSTTHAEQNFWNESQHSPAFRNNTCSFFRFKSLGAVSCYCITLVAWFKFGEQCVQEEECQVNDAGSHSCLYVK